MGFTYHKSGKRYLYRETVQAVGNALWIVLLAYLIATNLDYWRGK